MAPFDIKNLYTNIPITETLEKSKLTSSKRNLKRNIQLSS